MNKKVKDNIEIKLFENENINKDQIKKHNAECYC